MGWFSNTLDAVKKATAHDPVACPRGWGDVSFVASVWVVPPLFGVDRRCPIGGVAQCGDCSYASNPDAFRLAEQFGELQRLRNEGLISADEFTQRRGAAIHLHPARPPGRPYAVAAWILGPLGALFTVVGISLAPAVHPALWGLAALGSVFLVLTVSFCGLARSARPPSDG